MKRMETVVFTNMCMVYDDAGTVLVQDPGPPLCPRGTAGRRLGARGAQPLLWELTPPSSPSSVLGVCQQLPTQGGLVAF